MINYTIILELFLVASNIKKVYGVLDSFLSFLRKYEERKAHNMLLLMLDPRFKNLHLVFSFVGPEQGISIVEENDRKSLQLLLLKRYHHLHPLENYDVEST
jgi:hypothetical protein